MAQLAYLCEETPRAHMGVPPDVLAPSVSLFGGPERLGQLAGDMRRSGLAVQGSRSLHDLLRGDRFVLGDICVVDCCGGSDNGGGNGGGSEDGGGLDGSAMAALVRLDERVMRSGAELVVLASMATLEDAFGCVENPRAQFLVDATPAQQLVALGQALSRVPGRRVRELDEEDRLAVLRLTQEVARLSEQLAHMAPVLRSDDADMANARLASPNNGYRGEDERDLMRKPRVALPDPRLIHQIIRQRRLRGRFFDGELFADPAWDILLDLTAARAEHRRVSVTSLCIAAAVPSTTALRWIGQMTEMGMLLREQDPEDKRRAFITLAEPVADAMARYFHELGKDAAKLV